MAEEKPKKKKAPARGSEKKGKAALEKTGKPVKKTAKAAPKRTVKTSAKKTSKAAAKKPPRKSDKGEAKKKTAAKASPSKVKSPSKIPVEVKPGTISEKKKTTSRSSKPVSYDPVSAYYQEVRHYPILTREEEKDIAIRYLETEDIDAAYELVTSNLRLVIKIALEYRKLWRDILDLIQEGNVGLMHAVKKYDPYRGVRFSSYSAWWIRAYIIRYIMNNARMVKLGTTQAQRTLYFQLGKEKERLRRMGVDPDVKAIAKSLDVKESEVEEMTQRLSGGDVSLEASRGRDSEEFTLLDVIPSQQPDAEKLVADAQAKSLYLEKLAAFVATLPERDKKIFTSRWMGDDPLTLQELGDELGITRERVRQLEKRIVDRLREYLDEEGLIASDFFP
ncbi:MAG: RNA polymerase factor sigma-32 [bacterium]